MGMARSGEQGVAAGEASLRAIDPAADGAPWPLAALEPLLAPLRGRQSPPTLVEFAPAALSRERLWADYLPRARIVAVRPAWPADPPPPDLAARLRRRGGSREDDALLGRILAEDQPDAVLDAGEGAVLPALAALFPPMPAGAPGLSAGRAAGGGPARACLAHAAALQANAPPPAPPAGSPPWLAALAALLARCATLIEAGPGLLALIRNDARLPEAYPARPLAELADRLRAAETGGPYHRLPAELHDCPEALRRRFAAEAGPPGREVPAFAGQVGLLEGAVVRGRGVVLTRRGALVEESLINAATDPMAAGLLKLEAGRRYLDPAGPLPPARRLAGAPRILLKQHWDDNYGHWLIESLPRLDLVARAGWLTPGARCLVQAEEGPMRRVYLDSLAFFGLGEDRVEFVSGAPVTVETLIYPTPLTRQPWRKAPCVAALLARFPAFAAGRLGPAMPEAPRRIFVTRDAGLGRRLVNQAEIAASLRRRGFAVVAPERLGFWEQVAVFSRAELVVGVLGAGMANLAFAPRGVACIALASEWMGDDFFYDLICHKAGRYVSLHGRATDPAQGMRADFTLDLDRLEALLP